MPETTGAIILTNEQPVEGCKECQILWFNLVNYRNQFRMRPTERRIQDAFDMAQDDFLQHYKDEHQQKIVAIARKGKFYCIPRFYCIPCMTNKRVDENDKQVSQSEVDTWILHPGWEVLCSGCDKVLSTIKKAR